MSPEQINVGRVLDTLGGRLFSATFCDTHAGESCVCVHSVDCSLRSLWRALDHAVQAVVQRTQLSHLLGGELHMISRLVAPIEAPSLVAKSS